MDEATAFYSGALRTSQEVIQLMCAMLDQETVEIVAAALEDGFRLALLADPTGLIVVLLDQRSGQLGPVLGSVNARTGRETIYGLRRETHATGDHHVHGKPVCG